MLYYYYNLLILSIIKKNNTQSIIPVISNKFYDTIGMLSTSYVVVLILNAREKNRKKTQPR